MATSLGDVAQKIMDLYYQDYAPRDAFFSLDDFQFHAATYYTDALDTLFQGKRAENKMRDGFTNMEIPSEWLVSEQIKLEKNSALDTFDAVLPTGIFAFVFDGFSNAIYNVIPLKKDCNGRKYELVKISNNEAKFLSLAAETSLVYYYSAPGNKISFTRDIGEVEVWYIPAFNGKDENCLMSDSIVADVIKGTINIMVAIRNGTVVQEANDGNRNLTLQNQQNPTATPNTQ